MKNIEIVKDLLSRKNEEEWFEFKLNWFNPDEIGEYISSISNSAILVGKKYGYVVWGIDDNKKVVGTTFDYQQNCNENEPFQNFLARNLNPSIAFKFEKIKYLKKELVLLTIPAASKIPTSYKGVRFIRIGSSKVKLSKYPEREGELWNALYNGYPTMINTQSPKQNLHFSGLKIYYSIKQLKLNENYKNILNLFDKNNKYNMLACFLSDNGNIPLRVSVFEGIDQSSKLKSIKEFGNRSLIYAIEQIIQYSNSLNLIKSTINISTGIRSDISLFDQESFNEAVKNAIIHNDWTRRISPMITFFSDRVEITSFSGLARKQTISGFFEGKSIPVNEDLSSIYLNLHLSERAGKGVKTITSKYGRSVFNIEENQITVTIPYAFKQSSIIPNIDNALDSLGLKEQQILGMITKNPFITQPEIAKQVKLGTSRVQQIIKKLKEEKYITRQGTNKKGFWKINK